MPANAGSELAAPNLKLTSEEKRVYGQLFRQADNDNAGFVTGEVAVNFFDRTRLDSTTLGEIWQIADKENRGFLLPPGFSMVLRLIGHAQAGRAPTEALALQPGPLPQFDGFVPAPAAAPSSPPSAAAALQEQNTGGGVRIPPLTPEKVAQYTTLFEHQSLRAGNLPGDVAKSIFERSGMSNEILGRIWGLADTEQRGELVLTEFIIAMHLLTSMKTGSLRTLPNVLPAALYEAAARRGSISGGARPIVPPLSPTGSRMSTIPRQLTGQGQIRAGSPLGRAGSPSANDWAVTPADKAKFDQIYATLDTTNKGFITGAEAVPFFSRSNLGEDALAQIWDLSDTQSRGFLSRDEFAVAMYLIRQFRTSRPGSIPTTLPTNLIPPSLRSQPQPPQRSATFDTVQTAPAPPPAPHKPSAMDDLFGLDSGAPSPAPVAPKQTQMDTGGSNDPFSGGPSLAPSSPTRSATGTTSSFKPFVPSSTFGRGLAGQSTDDSPGSSSKQIPTASASEDLLGDNDPDASKNISGETTELAHLSNQVGSLSKQMQDVQGKKSVTQGSLNQTNAQKQNFEQRLAQLRTLYEKEAESTRALEEQLKKAREDTQKLSAETLTLEGNYQDVKTRHQEVVQQLQADQQENTNLRERIRVVNAEIAQLKPKIEKLKSEARQQKGLVAINKKQLTTTEGERDRLKIEADDLAKGNEEIARQAEVASPPSAAAQNASPALSASSATNPFFKRTASTDVTGAIASPPPPGRSFTDQSFDDMFGPTPGERATVSPPPQLAALRQQHTGASTTSNSSFATPPATATPALSRQGTTAGTPPPPPESRQITSNLLPFPEHSDSLTSSRQVSPPMSCGEGSGDNAPNPFPGDAGVTAASETKAAETTDAAKATTNADEIEDAPNHDDAVAADKAKAEFDNAFAAFTSANKGKGNSDTQEPDSADFDDAFASATKGKGKSDQQEPSKAKSAFDSEFPPIADLDHDESDSSSDAGGFDDDFSPASPRRKSKGPAITTSLGQNDGPQLPPKEPLEISADSTSPPTSNAPKSPPADAAATTTSTVRAEPVPATSDATEPEAGHTAPAAPPKNAFDDLDDEFEGLEDAKEASAADDFANISRSGGDTSPPASQTKTESTTYGNESSFDFVSSSASGSAAFPAAAAAIPAGNTASNGAVLPQQPHQQQQQPQDAPTANTTITTTTTTAVPASAPSDAHDWDAIFADLGPAQAIDPLRNPDSQSPLTAPAPAPAPVSAQAQTEDNRTLAVPSSPASMTRPGPPGRALTDSGAHDDPILKSLTDMGFARPAALAALEKFDYNQDKAVAFLTPPPPKKSRWKLRGRD